MKRFIDSLIRPYIQKPVVPLGRWNLDRCDTKIHSKVDLSNEDHCGVCHQYGQFMISKINHPKYGMKDMERTPKTTPNNNQK
jgi:hypothetical protein